MGKKSLYVSPAANASLFLLPSVVQSKMSRWQIHSHYRKVINYSNYLADDVKMLLTYIHNESGTLIFYTVINQTLIIHSLVEKLK